MHLFFEQKYKSFCHFEKKNLKNLKKQKKVLRKKDVFCTSRSSRENMKNNFPTFSTTLFFYIFLTSLKTNIKIKYETNETKNYRFRTKKIPSVQKH